MGAVPIGQDHVRIAPNRVMAPIGSEVVLKASMCGALAGAVIVTIANTLLVSAAARSTRKRLALAEDRLESALSAALTFQPLPNLFYELITNRGRDAC